MNSYFLFHSNFLWNYVLWNIFHCRLFLPSKNLSWEESETFLGIFSKKMLRKWTKSNIKMWISMLGLFTWPNKYDRILVRIWLTNFYNWIRPKNMTATNDNFLFYFIYYGARQKEHLNDRWCVKRWQIKALWMDKLVTSIS